MRCATGQQNSGKHGTFTGNQHHFKAKCFQFLSKGIHKVKKNIDNRHNLFHIFIMAVTSMGKKQSWRQGTVHTVQLSPREWWEEMLFSRLSQGSVVDNRDEHAHVAHVDLAVGVEVAHVVGIGRQAQNCIDE